MRSILIINPNDVLFFSNAYDKATNDLADGFEYLSNAKVRAFYKNNGEFLGGYAVSTTDLNPYLRYYSFLSKADKEAILNEGYREEDCAEITFIFFEKCANPIQRLRILIRSLFDARAMNKKYILGGGKVTKFNNRMKRVLSNQIFEGKVLVYGKLKDFKILCQERKYLYFKMLKAFFIEIKILFF